MQQPIDEAVTTGADNGNAPGGGGNPAYRVSAADEPTHRLLTRYLQRRHQQLDQLAAALAATDYELIRRIGHNLYGSGAAYGLPRISQIGGALESAAERGDAAAAGRSIGQLREFLAVVIVQAPRT